MNGGFESSLCYCARAGISEYFLSLTYQWFLNNSEQLNSRLSWTFMFQDERGLACYLCGKLKFENGDIITFLGLSGKRADRGPHFLSLKYLQIISHGSRMVIHSVLRRSQIHLQDGLIKIFVKSHNLNIILNAFSIAHA